MFQSAVGTKDRKEVFQQLDESGETSAWARQKMSAAASLVLRETSQEWSRALIGHYATHADLKNERNFFFENNVPRWVWETMWNYTRFHGGVWLLHLLHLLWKDVLWDWRESPVMDPFGKLFIYLLIYLAVHDFLFMSYANPENVHCRCHDVP